jgi:hypothetical protein
MDERILLEPVKRTGFSAPGDKPGKFAESDAGLALSGSHRAHKRRVHARISRSLQIVGKHYRLCGGERRIRTPGTLRGNSAKILGQTGWVFGLETSNPARETMVDTFSPRAKRLRFGIAAGAKHLWKFL